MDGNPNSEGRKPKEFRTPNTELRKKPSETDCLNPTISPADPLQDSDFGFLSEFGVRNSELGQGPFLVLGYGNELRSDDAAGPMAARAIAAWGLPGVHVRVEHQLTPDLAEPISKAGAVLFIDAAVAEGTAHARLRAIQPAGAQEMRAHVSDPGILLALAQALYGRCPAAWLATIPAFNLEVGEGLSAGTRAALEQALAGLRKEFNKITGFLSSRG